MDTHAEQLICKVIDSCARPAEKEELESMATENPEIAQALAEQQDAVNAIRSVGLRELSDEVQEQYWCGVYNRVENRSGWTLIVAGIALVVGYAIYELVTDPTIHTIYRIGIATLIVGFGLLISSKLRMRMKLTPYDRYKEVIR